MLNSSYDPDFGYFFYPHDAEGHLGHPQLDVIMPAVPTYPRFDTKKAIFQTVSSEGYVGRLTIRHPWTAKKKYHVCLGDIILTDRNAKKIEVFSFGCTLQIVSDENQTVCTLTSPAPIFPRFTTHSLTAWLVVEFEVLLARQEAVWDRAYSQDFETHLATLEPFLLYACCVQELHNKSLQEQAAHVRSSDERLENQGRHFLRDEIKRLQMQATWPMLLPTLDELFQPAS